MNNGQKIAEAGERYTKLWMKLCHFCDYSVFGFLRCLLPHPLCLLQEAPRSDNVRFTRVIRCCFSRCYADSVWLCRNMLHDAVPLSSLIMRNNVDDVSRCVELFLSVVNDDQQDVTIFGLFIYS